MNACSQGAGQFGCRNDQREQQQNLQRVCQGRPPLGLSSNTERTWARGLDPAPTLLLRRCGRIVACSPDVSSHNIAPPHPWTGFNAPSLTGAAAGVTPACASVGEPVGNNTKSGYASAPISGMSSPSSSASADTRLPISASTILKNAKNVTKTQTKQVSVPIACAASCDASP